MIVTRGFGVDTTLGAIVAFGFTLFDLGLPIIPDDALRGGIVYERFGTPNVVFVDNTLIKT